MKAAGLLDTVDQALTKMDLDTSVDEDEDEDDDGQIDLEDVIEAHNAQSTDEIVEEDEDW